MKKYKGTKKNKGTKKEQEKEQRYQEKEQRYQESKKNKGTRSQSLGNIVASTGKRPGKAESSRERFCEKEQ